MANLPIPQAGQPIDYSYIYQIVEALNELSTKVYSKFSESQVYNGTSMETHRLNDLSVVAGYKEVMNNVNASSAGEMQFTYDFANNFKYPPIVTATPRTLLNNATGRDVSVTITQVTTSSVTGYITFNSATTAKTSVGVNIIAVGIPSA